MKTYRITYIVKKCIQCPNTDDTDEILDKAMEEWAKENDWDVDRIDFEEI